MIGTKEEVQGRWGRRVEVAGGDLGGGRVRGEFGAICFYFPQPLAFFGFSPHNFLIRAKMHKCKKETKGRRHDPILTHPVCGHWGGGPNGGGWGGGFSFGWTDVGAKEIFFFEWSFEFEVEKTKRKVHLSTSGGEHWQRRVGDGFLFSDGCLLREI